jgi:hypothetical protein
MNKPTLQLIIKQKKIKKFHRLLMHVKNKIARSMDHKQETYPLEGKEHVDVAAVDQRLKKKVSENEFKTKKI